MKVYKKIILNKNDEIVYEDSYDYEGGWSYCGIHYDFKSTRGAKAMEKKAKREKKLAERRAKRQAKLGNKKEVNDFFENVIVNDEDILIKKNRLELLQMLCKTFDNYLNFSKIESL